MTFLINQPVSHFIETTNILITSWYVNSVNEHRNARLTQSTQVRSACLNKYFKILLILSLSLALMSSLFDLLDKFDSRCARTTCK